MAKKRRRRKTRKKSKLCPDLHQVQFENACRRRGFKRGLFNFWELLPGFKVDPSVVGPRRRDQLIYLIRARSDELERRIRLLNEGTDSEGGEQ